MATPVKFQGEVVEISKQLPVLNNADQISISEIDGTIIENPPSRPADLGQPSRCAQSDGGLFLATQLIDQFSS